MKLSQHLRYYFGFGLIGFGTFLTFGGVVQLNEGTETLGSFLSLVFFVGFLPIVSGAWLVYTAQKNLKEQRLYEKEKLIWDLALKSGGRVTVAQASSVTTLSASEADKILTKMQEKGMFNLKVSSKGVIVYEVAGMLEQGDELIDV